MKKLWLYPVLLAPFMLAAPALSNSAWAEDYVLTIKDHQFSPKEITIPANQKITLTVKNLDTAAAEFESSDLDREKVVNAGSQISVFLGPLDAGKYGFFNDFDRSATGTIIVK